MQPQNWRRGPRDLSRVAGAQDTAEEPPGAGSNLGREKWAGGRRPLTLEELQKRQRNVISAMRQPRAHSVWELAAVMVSVKRGCQSDCSLGHTVAETPARKR